VVCGGMFDMPARRWYSPSVDQARRRFREETGMKRRFGLAAWTVAALLAVVRAGDAATFRAFSLKAAEAKIKAIGSWWRVSRKDILYLGQINALDGLVYDSSRGDIILVGRQVEGRSKLTLDDLVVALRSRLRYNKWPMVRPDVTPESPKTHELFIRMEGGVERTAFGQTMVEASNWLASVAAGTAKNPPQGLRSSWQRLNSKGRKPDSANQLAARLWLFPICYKALLGPGVATFAGIRLKVYPQVILAAKDGKLVKDFYKQPEPAFEDFAAEASEKLEALCEASPALNRLRGLHELVVAAEAVAKLRPRPELSWWLMDYPLKQVEFTRKTAAQRQEQAKGKGWLDVMGACQLTAIVLAPEGGDVAAIKRVVLATRGSAVAWQFTVANWGIPGAKVKAEWEKVAELFARGWWLRQSRRYGEASEVYGQAAALAPAAGELWCAIGDVLYTAGRFEKARDAYDRATSADPSLALAWSGKALALTKLGLTARASQCYNKATELNPLTAVAWTNKGVAFGKLGQHERELECYDRALKIDPGFASAWCNKGVALSKMGKRREAIACLAKAVELEPSYAKAWHNLGALYAALKQGEKATECFRRAALLGFAPSRRILLAIQKAAKEKQEKEGETKPSREPKPK